MDRIENELSEADREYFKRLGVDFAFIDETVTFYALHMKARNLRRDPQACINTLLAAAGLILGTCHETEYDTTIFTIAATNAKRFALERDMSGAAKNFRQYNEEQTATQQ